MAKFGKDRFPADYQRHVGINASEMLQKNSIELVDILKKHNVLYDNINVFEMGAAGCRNLYYIWKENNSINLYANDLFRDASFEQMHDDIKLIVNFYEGDSEEVFSASKVDNLHLLLVSDHFMHLQREKFDSISKNILNLWKPKYIMLREVKREFEKPEHPKLYHNYDVFLQDYFLVEDTESKNVSDNSYFIWLLKRK